MKKGLLSKAMSSLVALTMMAATLPVLHASADTTVGMYVPNAEPSGVVNSWAGTQELASKTTDPTEYQQRCIYFEDGSWWGEQLKKEGDKDVTWWAAPRYNYNAVRKTVGVKVPDYASAQQWPHFYYHPAEDVVAADVQYIVLGMYSSRDIKINLYPTWEASNEYLSNNNYLIDLNLKQGFHEYLIDVGSTTSEFYSRWNNSETPKYDYFHFYDETGKQCKATDFEIAYMKFVNSDFDGDISQAVSGEEVTDGSTDYNAENNIADFVFDGDLDMSTVSTSTVQVNGQDTEWVMNNELSSDSIRVNLGALENTTKYTVSFNGMKYEDGTEITDTFTFTTSEAVVKPTPTPGPQVRDSIEMYTPSTDNTGAVSSWDGSATPVDTADMTAYQQRAVNFADGSWWGTKLKNQNGGDVTNWASPGYAYDGDAQAVGILLPAGSQQWPNFYYHPATSFKAADVKNIVIGLYSTKDATINMYPTNEASDEYISGNNDRLAVLNVKSGYHEYVIDVNDTDICANWINDAVTEYDYIRFYNTAGQSEPETLLKFSYIKFVNDQYKGLMKDAETNGTKVQDGAKDYDKANSTVDFLFPYALNFNTVTTSAITINGEPVKQIMTNSNVTDRVRVDLGTLKNNRTYTVSFDGITGSNGEEISGTYTFSTRTVAPVAEPVTPAMKKVDIQDGIIAAWNGTDALNPDKPVSGGYDQQCVYYANGNYWGALNDGEDVCWWSSVGYRYNEYAGNIGVLYPSGSPQWPNAYLNFANQVQSNDVSSIVIGVYSTKDTGVDIYFSNGVTGTVTAQTAIDVKAGLHEYVIPVNNITNWSSQTDFNCIKIAVAGGQAPAVLPVRMDFYYVRCVDDGYIGAIADMGAGSDLGYSAYATISADSKVVDFVFPYDIDGDTVKAENIMLNGAAARYVQVNSSKTNTFRAYFENMKPITRYTLTMTGIENTENAAITVNSMKFTTDVSTNTADLEKAVSTLEIVENYKTANEAKITDSLNGKTITAVCGGIWNNTQQTTENKLFLAIYKDGVLTSVKQAEKTLAAGAMTGEMSVSDNVPADGNYTAKAFAWSTMAPLTESVSVPKKNTVKVLVLGNSITKHAPNSSLGWAGDWGMAATGADKDYYHQLQAKVNEKYDNVEFEFSPMWDFERYFYNFDMFSPSAYSKYASYDADIILCTFGANINNADNEGDSSFVSGYEFNKDYYANIVNFFNRDGEAKVIAGITTLTRDYVMSAIKAAAEENNWACVDMSDLTDEKYLGLANKDADVFLDNVTEGVLIHPGDLGMQVMAERIFAAADPIIAAVAGK